VAVITSAATGVWSAGATWAGGVPPAAGVDSYVIANTHVVTVDAEYVGAGFLGGTVNAGGELVFSNAASARLHHSGDNSLTVNGTLTGDFSAVPALLAQITFAPATDGGAGLILNGIVNLRGAAKDHFRLLAADVGEWNASGDVATAGNVTDITLDAAPTGWQIGDLLAIAPTGRISTHWDTCIITGIVGPVVSVNSWQGTAPLYVGAQAKPFWNHQGAGTPAQARAEVLNLSRNVRVFSTDPTKRTYISIGATATVTMDYVETYSSGFSSAKPALALLCTTGSFDSTGISIHDSYDVGINVSGLTTGTVAVSSSVLSFCRSHGVIVNALALAGGGACSFTDTIAGGTSFAGRNGFYISDVGSTFPNCRAIGNVSNGFFVSENAPVADGILDGIVDHSNGNFLGLLAYGSQANALDGITIWRNPANAFRMAQTGSIHLSSPVIFGNAGAPLAQTGNVFVTNISEPTDIAAYEANLPFSTTSGRAEIIGGTLRGTANVGGASIIANGVTWNNFAAPLFTNNLGYFAYLLSFRHNNTADDHRMYYAFGSVLSNAVTRHTASGLSWQHLPSGGVAVWFRPNIPYRAAVVSGVAVTLSAWVYVDAAYNGTAKPRIVCLGGRLQGVPNDVIGTSHSGALAWELLTVAVTPTEVGMIEFVVEGQGTAGSFYSDDIGAA